MMETVQMIIVHSVLFRAHESFFLKIFTALIVCKMIHILA